MSSTSGSSDSGGILSRLRGLGKGRFARGVFVLAGGTAAGQALLVVLSPVLTRLYAPADLGRFGVFTAAVGVASVAVCLRYDTAIVSATDADAPLVARLAASVVVPMALVVTAVLAVAASLHFLALDQLGTAGTLLLLPALLLTGLLGIVRYWFIRKEELRPVSALAVIQNAVRGGSQVLLGALHGGWLGLLVGDMAGRAFGIASLARQTYREVRNTRTTTTQLFAVAGRYRAFSTYYLLSSVVDVAAQNLPVPLLAQAYGAETAGEFALVQRVVAAPLVLLAGTFADAFHGRLATLSRESPQLSLKFFLRSARLLLLIAIGPTVAFAALARPMFAFVFGARWAEAGLMVAWTMPWTLAQFVVSPLSRAALVHDGQRLKLVYDFTALACIVGAFRIATHLQLAIRGTLLSLTAAQAFSYAVYFALLAFIVRRHAAARI